MINFWMVEVKSKKRTLKNPQEGGEIVWRTCGIGL